MNRLFVEVDEIPVKILLNLTTSTDHLSVGKVLSCHVSYGQLGEDNLGPERLRSCSACLRGCSTQRPPPSGTLPRSPPHLGIVPLCLQHELRVEKGNVGFHVHLLLHFKASIAGSFLERNAVNNKGVL